MWKYTDLVMEHLQHPRNVGEVADPDAVAEVSNPVCGDTMRLTVRLVDGRVAEARFKTRGCGAAIATSSVTTELVRGRTPEELLALTNEEVAAALGGLPPAKMHCSVLAEDALHELVADYRRRATG
jgi:nitrogen fixation NifU-like protein